MKKPPQPVNAETVPAGSEWRSLDKRDTRVVKVTGLTATHVEIVSAGRNIRVSNKRWFRAFSREA